MYKVGYLPCPLMTIVFSFLTFTQYHQANMHQCIPIEDREKAKITNRYNHVPHLTHVTIQRMIKAQENITQKRASLEVTPFPTGENGAAIKGTTEGKDKHEKDMSLNGHDLLSNMNTRNSNIYDKP